MFLLFCVLLAGLILFLATIIAIILMQSFIESSRLFGIRLSMSNFQVQ